MKVQQGSYTFSLELDAPKFESKTQHALVDFLPKSMKKDGLSELANLVEQKAEAVWVQSRMMVVFGFTPLDETDRTSNEMLEASFRASEDSEDEEEGIVFTCLHKAGRTKLHFSSKVKKEVTKKIAKGFYKLLLAEPSELDDYDSEGKDATGAKVAFGVRDGRCFFGDPEADVDVPANVANGGGGGGLDFDPVAMEDDDDWISGRFNDDDDDDEDPFKDDDQEGGLFGDDDGY
jgi:hypothetical protein